jgi:very-short-patch-repair endonuclease
VRTGATSSRGSTEAIELSLAGSAGIKSRLERVFLQHVIDAGLTKPIPNIHVAGTQVDAYWPDVRLAVEIDGPNHMRPPSIVTDDSCDRLLAENAITVVRFTEFEIERRRRRHARQGRMSVSVTR